MSRGGVDEVAILAKGPTPKEVAAKKKALRQAKNKLAADASDWMLKTFEICSEAARKCGNEDRSATLRAWDYLGNIYDSTKHHHWDDRSFSKFCKVRQIPCTRATLRNPYKALITASRDAGGYPVDTKEASRLGRALVWANRQKVASGGLAEFLTREGGVSGCIRNLVKENRAAKIVNAISAPQSEPTNSTALNAVQPLNESVAE